jgi:hypothetical protein
MRSRRRAMPPAASWRIHADDETVLVLRTRLEGVWRGALNCRSFGLGRVVGSARAFGSPPDPFLRPRLTKRSTLSRVEREGLSPVLQLNHEHEQLGLAHIFKRVRR